MGTLTLKQKQVLDTVIEFIEQKNYPPSTRELGELLHHGSSSTTHEYLVKLKIKGYVDWEESKPRTLRVLRGA